MGLESIRLPQPFPIAPVLHEATRATCKLDVASEAGLGWLGLAVGVDQKKIQKQITI